jgi:hypothetical protein
MKSYDYRVRQFILSFAIICLVWFAAVPIFAQDGFAIDESVDHDIASEAWPGQYIVAFDSAQNVEAANTQLAQSGDMVQEITACGTGNVLQVWNVDESVVTRVHGNSISYPICPLH